MILCSDTAINSRYGVDKTSVLLPFAKYRCFGGIGELRFIVFRCPHLARFRGRFLGVLGKERL